MKTLKKREESYVVFEMLAEEATKGFAPEWKLNNEKYAAFKEKCKLF